MAITFAGFDFYEKFLLGYVALLFMTEMAEMNTALKYKAAYILW
jgi:hypothetical protein